MTNRFCQCYRLGTAYDILIISKKEKKKKRNKEIINEIKNKKNRRRYCKEQPALIKGTTVGLMLNSSHVPEGEREGERTIPRTQFCTPMVVMLRMKITKRREEESKRRKRRQKDSTHQPKVMSGASII